MGPRIRRAKGLYEIDTPLKGHPQNLTCCKSQHRGINLKGARVRPTCWSWRTFWSGRSQLVLPLGMQTLLKHPFLKHSTIITLVLVNAILESSLWPSTTGNRPHSPVGWHKPWAPLELTNSCVGTWTCSPVDWHQPWVPRNAQPTTQEDTVPSSGPSVTTWGTASRTIGPGASPAYQHARKVHLATREEGYF